MVKHYMKDLPLSPFEFKVFRFKQTENTVTYHKELLLNILRKQLLTTPPDQPVKCNVATFKVDISRGKFTIVFEVNCKKCKFNYSRWPTRSAIVNCIAQTHNKTASDLSRSLCWPTALVGARAGRSVVGRRQTDRHADRETDVGKPWSVCN